MAGERKLKVVSWNRKGAVLTRPALPCIAHFHTLNLTAGCPNECFYCYTQSYQFVPEWGTVAYFGNMRDRLRDELPRMKRPPVLVYFSTYGEPFLLVKPILDAQFDIMRILLEHGIWLLISTKGIVEDRFINLFAHYPKCIHVQVGITTVDDAARAVLEPYAATVEQRLDNLRRLYTAGVSCEPRLDPLVPGLTDTDESMGQLMKTLGEILPGNRVAASFMFLRWGIKPPKVKSYNGWSFPEMRKIYTHRVTDYCGGGKIWLPTTEYRKERYDTLRKLSCENNLDLHLCACKNSDITTSDCCHPLPEENREPTPPEQKTFL
jgi:DNA repair photolyase